MLGRGSSLRSFRSFSSLSLFGLATFIGCRSLCRSGLPNDLDVVDVCTPPGLHVPMVRRVLESGRDAICEKPLAGSLAEVDALAACERAVGG